MQRENVYRVVELAEVRTARREHRRDELQLARECSRGAARGRRLRDVVVGRGQGVGAECRNCWRGVGGHRCGGCARSRARNV